MANLLDRRHDPVFGEMTWDTDDLAWKGLVRFGHRTVSISLDPGLTAPSAAEQLAVIEPARRLFDGLPVVELELQRQAAVQIAEAVAEQDAEQEENAELLLSRFAASLELEEISLQDCGGALHYRSPEFFPGQHVTIFFDEVLAFGGAEVYD